MQFLKWSRFLFALAILIPLLSCTGTQSEDLAPASHPPPTPSPTTAPTKTPLPTPQVADPVRTDSPLILGKRDQEKLTGLPGGTLTIASSADTDNFDVHRTHQKTLSTLGPGLVYSRLLRVQTGPRISQPSLILECDLCLSWKLNSDFSYEFLLPSNIHWQNIHPLNGRRMVASDLAYSYNRMETESWPYSTLFKDRGISKFLTESPTSLKIKRAFLDTDVLLALADGRSKIVAPEAVKMYGDLSQGPVIGTGPWIWESTEHGIGTKLSRNPDYFEAGLPYLDNLFIKTIKPAFDPYVSRTQQIAAFKTGLVDVIRVSSLGWNTLQSSTVEFNSYKSDSNSPNILLWFNTRTDLGSNRRIRQATFYSLDPWESLHSIWKDLGSVNVGLPVSNPDWLLPKNSMRQKYFANPSEARKKLENHNDNQPLNIAIADSSKEMLEYAKEIKEALTRSGFNPTIRLIHPSHNIQILTKGDDEFDLIIGQIPYIPSPNGFLLAFIHSDGPANILRHADKKLDRMIEGQIAEGNPITRKEKLLELQQYLLEEAYLYSPVSDITGWAFNWNLQDFYPNTALSESIFWTKVWLKS